MKKTLFTIVAVLMAGMGMQAVADDYLPLVREGVRWHYVKSFTDSQEEIFEDTPFYYEFKGDSIFNGKTFKKCFIVSSKPEESGLVAIVREEDKKVYRKFINPYMDIDYNFGEDPILIYNFNPTELTIYPEIENVQTESIKSINIQGIDSKCYQVKENGFGENICLIEGMGVDLYNTYRFYHGNLLMPLIPHTTGYVETVYYFDRLEDLNGNILYDTGRYTGVTDLKSDDRKGDDAYYNLQGQRVDNPTQGIYIHNGKKVVVK